MAENGDVAGPGSLNPNALALADAARLRLSSGTIKVIFVYFAAPRGPRSGVSEDRGTMRGGVIVNKPPDFQAILERCITENSNDAWTLFFSAFRALIRRVYHAHGDAVSFPEFECWLPGWLYYERKLHAAYRALRAKVDSGECSTPVTQERYLANYLATIIRAAAAEFHRERRSDFPRQVPDADLSAVPAAESPPDPDMQGRVLAVLPLLPPDLRIPFWLRYYRVFGPLTPEDAAWVAERSGMTAKRVTEAVAREAEMHRSRRKPLSSEFIGSLLGIAPCGDGEYSTVDQRVRRAILRIREQLADAGEEGNA
ncbi:MAG: hypothetical protein KatS3mg109_0426 [Pirellulaceae bacterium]|nr:MAG: hypothetical protein KatS3mg109_0426 [Pirellulaceae bacterium]